MIVGGVGEASEQLGFFKRVFQNILDEKYLGVHFAAIIPCSQLQVRPARLIVSPTYTT